MKKRIIGILLIVVLAVTMLTGCLGVNTERDMKQTVATITYKGNTAKVTKLESLEQYAQYVDVYVQYYGMTEREVYDYFLDQLSVRKLLVLDAVDRGICQWDNVNMQIVPESLTVAQRNEAQDNVNKELKELFDEYVKTVTEEYEGTEESGNSDSGAGDEEEEDTRTVRPLPVEDEEETVYSSTELNVQSWYKNFEYSNSYERIAFRRLETLLENQYKSEETLLQANYESLVIKALQEKLYSSISVTDAQIFARYELDKSKQKEKFDADETAYGKAIKNNEVLYYHPKTGYGTVKHILLSFEEASLEGRKAENKHIYFEDESKYSKAEFDSRSKSGLYSDDAIKAYREAMLMDMKVNDYGDFAEWWPTYDKEEMADLIDWRDLKFDATTVTKLGVMELAQKVSVAVDAKTTEQDKIAKFVDYIFGYNNADESGMFNNENDYVIEPEGKTYMEEFQAISEWLITGTAPAGFTDGGLISATAGEIGSMGVCVTDYGAHLVMVTNIFAKSVGADGFYAASSAEDLKGIIIDYEDGTTIYSYIYDKLLEAEKTNVMNSYQTNFIDIHGESSIKLNDGVINAIFA